jgi:hypothetical protein
MILRGLEVVFVLALVGGLIMVLAPPLVAAYTKYWNNYIK